MMGSDGEPRTASAKRRAVRGFVLVSLLAALALIIAEWLAPEIGVARGALLSAGLVLCLSANLLCLLLLAARRGR